MISRLKRLVLPIAWALALDVVASEEPLQMLHRNWNSEDGLPQERVRVMVQTRDGFLWLGTDAGLARFDGTEFKVYDMRDGLGALTVLDLLEASDGALWIGTLDGGVSVMRNGRIERSFSRPDGIAPGRTSVLAEDADGRIWLAGAYRLEAGGFVPVEGARQSAKKVFKDREGTLWMSLGNTRIIRWKGGKWLDGSGGGPGSADGFCEDAEGRLWVADANRRIWCRDGTTWKSWPFPADKKHRVNSLSMAADGTLWIAFFREGVCAFKDGKFVEIQTRQGDFLGLAESILASRDGLLWMGSSTGGLYSLSPRRVEMALIENGGIIGGLVEEAPGEILVGTQGHGIFRWKDGASHLMPQFEPFHQGLFVNKLMRARDGMIWVATSRGLFHYAGDQPGPLKPVQTRVLGDIWELCEDRMKGVWVGQSTGELLHFTDMPRKLNYGSRSGPIKGLAQTSDGALWVGTRGSGLFRVKNGQHRRFGVTDGLGSEVIRVVYAASDGSLWVGTAGGGLSIWLDGHFHSITTEDGLPDDVVSQITEDERGRLWLGTNRGLAVLEADEVNAVKRGRRSPLHPLLINRADGLIAEECTIVPPVRMADGRMAFATIHGFGMLRQEDFNAEKITPPVFIERVIANGREVVPVNGSVSLPPGLGRLEIEFTGLHFSAPKRLRFRNRLAGLEEEWGPESKLRSVEYRNLAPGGYRFELSGSNGNGRWTPEPAVLEISVAPFYWQTLWFRIGTGLSVMGLLAAFVRRREQLKSLGKIEILKREQAVQEERARIARDLHDDVGSSLTQVALLSELADSDLSERPDEARGHINEIFNTAKDVTRSLDEIVWAVNPAQDTLERFAAFLGIFVQGYARTAGLTARIDMPAVIPKVTVRSPIRHHLYLATKEALHNVVKHADATEIRLRFIPQDHGILLTIEDNGQGIGEIVDDDGDGMSNLRKRLSQIGGTCSHRPAPGSGTIVEFFAPLSMD